MIWVSTSLRLETARFFFELDIHVAGQESLDSLEPLGTITMYYPFLDAEIVDILDSIMKKASDYHEFVVRLGEKAYRDNVPVVLVYLTVVHARRLNETSVLKSLRSKYRNSEVILPWLLPDVDNQDEIDSALEVVRSGSLGEWIEIELLILSMFPEENLEIVRISSSLNEIKALLQAQPNLECFRPYMALVESSVQRHEGDIENALLTYEAAIEQAKENNDMYIACRLLLYTGSLIKNFDVKKSWENLQEAYDLARLLGYQLGMAESRFEMGKTSFILGEYDLAEKCLAESYNVHEETRRKTTLMEKDIPLVRTWTLCELERYDEALEWGESVREFCEPEEYPWGHLAAAHSLIFLGNLEKASKYITQAQTGVMKSGREFDLAYFYYVSGLYENESGDLLNGMATIERALEICERLQFVMLVSPCLIALTKGEIALHSIEGDSDISGRWMSRLEQYAREKNLPGILMQHAILKAEFQMQQGRKDAARKTLTKGLDIYDSPSVLTLRSRIEQKLEELDSIEHEPT
jgi:tetratricopeptide (TPR) repeat protein